MKLARLALVAALGAPACAPAPYEVKRTLTPDAAAKALSERPARASIVRGEERTELPEGARIEGAQGSFRVMIPPSAREGNVRKLEDGDEVVVDEAGRIIAIRTAAGAETRFAPGSATQKPGTDEVILEAPETIAIREGDRIEVKSFYEAGDVVPGVGHVEVERRMATLVGGGLLLLAGYGPALYVGASSPLKADRVLLAPVVGPWIDLGTRPKCVPPAGSDVLPVDPCTGETVVKVGLVASGIAQGLGAILVVLGMPSEAVLVRDDTRSVRLSPFSLHGEF